MIFVTVGTTQPFGELIEEVDRLAGEGFFGDQEVVCQIGQSDVSPRHVTHFSAKPDVREEMASSDFLITHGGATVIEALRLGKYFLAVANPRASEDHQGLFLEEIGRAVNFYWTRDWTEIAALYKKALANPPPRLRLELPKAHRLLIDRFLS